MVHVTGESRGNGTGFDITTVAYKHDGTEDWAERLNGDEDKDDAGKSISVDADGNIFVAASIQETGSGKDYGTIKYSDQQLPVQLTSFNAYVSGKAVRLEWITNWELNNRGFEVEKKIFPDGNWNKINFVTGHGTTNFPNCYKYEDLNSVSAKYRYRLKQIDYNGNFEYYDLRSDVFVGPPAECSLSQNYPNPSNPVSKIDYQIPSDGMVTLKVYDIKGAEVAVLIDGFNKAGYYTVGFDGRNLSSGVYFYRIISNALTLTKKMTLIK